MFPEHWNIQFILNIIILQTLSELNFWMFSETNSNIYFIFFFIVETCVSLTHTDIWFNTKHKPNWKHKGRAKDF